jgi:hypothetical protein
MTKRPSPGRIVQYVPSAKEKEKWKVDTIPAMIVRSWSVDMLNLRLFTDGPPCQEEYVCSVEYSGLKAERSWHWPEIHSPDKNWFKPEP